MPAAFMASRSRVMPSRLILRPIQCHQTIGLAAAGGLAKSSSRVVAAWVKSGRLTSIARALTLIRMRRVVVMRNV